jgi:hypothetical protein
MFFISNKLIDVCFLKQFSIKMYFVYRDWKISKISLYPLNIVFLWNYDHVSVLITFLIINVNFLNNLLKIYEISEICEIK